MATEKRLKAYDPITFESFTRHATKHREPYDQYDMGYTDAVDNIEDWLDANTVEAVEVIRCKDCKKWFRHTEVDRERGECRRYQTTKHEAGYCDRGERKDNE